MMPEKWVIYFANIAKQVSTLSKDPNTKVGAVIVGEDKNIISTGFNGFPFGMYDCPKLLGNRKGKLNFMVHAEANAVCLAARTGVGLKNSSIFVTKFPCNECVKLLIQSGVKAVYAPEPNERDFKLYKAEISLRMIKECGLIFVAVD